MIRIVMLFLLCCGSVFAQTNLVKIPLTGSNAGWSVLAIGNSFPGNKVSVTDTVVGVFDSPYWEFEIAMTGSYDYWYSTTGGEPYNRLDNFSGTYGRMAFAPLDLSRALTFQETADPDNNGQVDTGGIEDAAITRAKASAGFKTRMNVEATPFFKSSDAATWAALKDSATANNAAILINNTIAIAGETVIAEDLHFSSTGRLKTSNAVTDSITIKGSIHAGNYQIFDTTSIIKFSAGNAGVVNACWFGAKGDGLYSAELTEHGDMESLSTWSAYLQEGGDSYALSTTQAHRVAGKYASTRSIRVVVDAAGEGIRTFSNNFANIWLQRGKTYRVSVWVYVNIGTVGLRPNGGQVLSDAVDASTGTGAWEELTMTVQPNSDGYQGFLIVSSGGGADWYVDNYDVREYNASATNNSRPIQKAIDAARLGGTVYLPAGNYLIRDHIVITRPVNLLGDGVGSVVYAYGYDSVDPFRDNRMIVVNMDQKFFAGATNDALDVIGRNFCRIERLKFFSDAVSDSAFNTSWMDSTYENGPGFVAHIGDGALIVNECYGEGSYSEAFYAENGSSSPHTYAEFTNNFGYNNPHNTFNFNGSTKGRCTGNTVIKSGRLLECPGEGIIIDGNLSFSCFYGVLLGNQSGTYQIKDGTICSNNVFVGDPANERYMWFGIYCGLGIGEVLITNNIIKHADNASIGVGPNYAFSTADTVNFQIIVDGNIIADPYPAHELLYNIDPPTTKPRSIGILVFGGVTAVNSYRLRADVIVSNNVITSQDTFALEVGIYYGTNTSDTDNEYEEDYLSVEISHNSITGARLAGIVAEKVATPALRIESNNISNYGNYGIYVEGISIGNNDETQTNAVIRNNSLKNEYRYRGRTTTDHFGTETASIKVNKLLFSEVTANRVWNDSAEYFIRVLNSSDLHISDNTAIFCDYTTTDGSHTLLSTSNSEGLYSSIINGRQRMWHGLATDTTKGRWSKGSIIHNVDQSESAYTEFICYYPADGFGRANIYSANVSGTAGDSMISVISSSQLWRSGDAVVIPGAGAAASTLSTIIAKVYSTTSFELRDQIVTTVSGVTMTSAVTRWRSITANEVQQVSASIPLDLSGAAQTYYLFTPRSDRTMTKIRAVYSEASSADAGVTIRVGTAANASLYTASTSQINKSIWDIQNINPSSTALANGVPVIVNTPGGKTGTGEVIITVEYR